MKTDALISMLASGPVAVDPRSASHRLMWAAAAGFGMALVAMLALLGPRPDIAAAVKLPMFWLKLAFPLALAVAACAAVSPMARPGGRAGAAWLAIGAMLGLVWLMSAVLLAAAPAGARAAMVEGGTARACLTSIAMLSLPGLAAMFIALRGLAPTRPVAAGIAAGAVAGSIAAAVYALHCTEMALPFYAAWYVSGMALPALLGAVVGPRLLRWT